MKIPFIRSKITIGIILSFLAGIVFSLPVRGQVTDYLPVRQDTNFLAGLSEKYQQRYKSELDKLPTRNKKDYLDVYGRRWEHIKEKFDKQEIYTSKDAQDYLDRLVALIVKGNPVLQGPSFRCYFSRSAIPNASYIGEGIILFHMGLFSRMGNESEVVFVLCHEMAHLLLQHTENSITQYVTTLNSPEVQEQLKKIKGTEYRKREQLEKLVKGMNFDSRRHSRDHESQADSMAVELMLHTPFDLSGALTTLALLDGIDTDTLNTKACLRKVFNSTDYPFQEKWIVKQEGLLGGHARLKKEEMEDSLKTHPACKERIRLLTPFVNAHPSARALKFAVDSPKFEKLKNIFRYETVEYGYLSDHYTESLFLTLELLQKNPTDTYLVTQVGRLMNGLYSAQKAHTLSKVADLPSPDYPANYNLLLQFIQNLYLENIANISYHYLSQYHPKMDAYSPFKDAYTQSTQINQ